MQMAWTLGAASVYGGPKDNAGGWKKVNVQGNSKSNLANFSSESALFRFSKHMR